MSTKAEILEQIGRDVKLCRKCRLCETAIQGVPGEGSVESELVFIGEAPGQKEDETGRPFVGRAGMLLQKLLSDIGLERKDVWIGNIIKHRPPQNRDPLPDEIKACAPYLAAQLKTLKPKLIVTLGRFSMNYFYPEGKISRDHGHMIKVREFNVYPIYHPAAGLRNTNVLKILRDDFRRIPLVLKEIENQKKAQQHEIDSMPLFSDS